jgi:hypothetical protein
MARNGRSDRLHLLQIGLILLLLGLGVILYWRPAADGLLAPRWWHWVVLAAIFFSVVGLVARRRRLRSRRALRAGLDETGAERPDGAGL